MIKTADEYYAKVQRIDQDRIEKAISRIPWNINRAGKLYAKKLKEITNQK